MGVAAVEGALAFGQFASELQRVLRGLAGGWPALLPAALHLARMERGSRLTLAKVRSAMALCAELCHEGACLGRLLEHAALIRDLHAEIYGRMAAFPLGFLFRKRVELSLHEWDNLVEDCAVASDPEIREMLIELAGRM